MQDGGEQSLVTRQLRSKLAELTSRSARLALPADSPRKPSASPAATASKTSISAPPAAADGASKQRDASVQATLGPCTRDRVDSLTREADSPLDRRYLKPSSFTPKTSC